MENQDQQDINLSAPETPAPEPEPVLENIQFTKVEKKNGEIEYKNSQEGRKIIILSPSSPEPREGVPYKVRVLQDISPKNPKPGKIEGKMIVELVFETQEDKDKETLDKAEALLKKATTAEDYQQLAKLYAEVERAYTDPEQKGEHLKGRDPEKFLREVFSFLKEINFTNNVGEKSWPMDYYPDEKIVDTHMELMPNSSLRDSLRSTRFIDDINNDKVPEQDEQKAITIRGWENLAPFLKGKRIQSILNFENQWVLKIIEEEQEKDAETNEKVEHWERFYSKEFGIHDLGEIKIPERTEAEKKEFTQLIVVAKGITTPAIIDKFKALGAAIQFGGTIEEDIKAGKLLSARSPANGSYAVWARDRADADIENANKSSKDIEDQGIESMTLAERLLLDIESSSYLDSSGTKTLCSGSTSSSSYVPLVFRDSGNKDLVINISPEHLKFRDRRARTVIAE